MIHLDQNVLSDHLSRIEKSTEYELWRRYATLVYSPITMAETYKCDASTKASIVANFQKFKSIGVKGHLSGNELSMAYTYENLPFAEAFEAFCRASDWNPASLYGASFLQKLMGGKKQEDFQKTLNEDLAQAETIFDPIIDEIQLINDGKSDIIIKQLLEIKETVIRHLEASNARLADKLEIDLEKSSFHDPIEALRGGFKSDPSALQKFKGRNAINSLWTFIQGKSELGKNFRTIDQLAGFDGINPVTNKNFTIQEKIRSLMILLHQIGYFPDRKIENDDKFRASIRDVEHAVYGSFCDVLITRDTRLQHKLLAVYGHLNIDTSIYSITDDREFCLEFIG